MASLKYNWQPIIVTELSHTTGEHLVIVRYSAPHRAHKKWAYNAADIDHARIVWACEIPGVDTAPPLACYPVRKVWFVEPDGSRRSLLPMPLCSTRPVALDRPKSWLPQIRTAESQSRLAPAASKQKRNGWHDDSRGPTRQSFSDLEGSCVSKSLYALPLRSMTNQTVT